VAEDWIVNHPKDLKDNSTTFIKGADQSGHGV